MKNSIVWSCAFGAFGVFVFLVGSNCSVAFGSGGEGDHHCKVTGQVKERVTDADFVKDIPKYRAALLDAEKARPRNKKLVAKRCYELARLLVHDRSPGSFAEQERLYKRALSLTDEREAKYATYEAAWSDCSQSAAHRYALKKLRLAKDEKTKMFCCMNLACESMQQKQSSLSLHWTQEAFDHYLRTDEFVSCFFPFGLIYFDCLVKDGHAEELERFLKSSLSKVEELRPNDRMRIAGMNYLVFAFLAGQNRDDECEKYLEKALQCDLTTGFSRYCGTCSLLPEVPCDGATMAARVILVCTKVSKDNPQLARELLNKLLASQEKVLAGDSLGVSLTKQALEAVK